MQEATLHILELPIVGLTLEKRQDGLSELTIDLQTVVPAASLARLLSSLAELYSIGYAAAGRPDVGFISFGKQWVSPVELIITKLEIGTPNKVKVTGASAVLDDIYKIMRILTLAVALLTPANTGGVASETGGTRVQVETTVQLNQPDSSPHGEGVTILDLNKALNENIAMMVNLEQALARGEIPLHAYLEQRARYEAINKQLMDELKVTRVRSATTRHAP